MNIRDEKLGLKHVFIADYYGNIEDQLSRRGGMLICEDLGERVKISGEAVCYMSGEIRI